MEELPPLKILIADDASVMRMLLKTMLRRFISAEVTEARTGAEALKLATTVPFDMVFLDVTMPGMTGLSVLDALRKTEHYAQRPVVLLTALGSEASQERGLALGASAYLLKPLREMQLLRALMKLVPEALQAQEKKA